MMITSTRETLILVEESLVQCLFVCEEPHVKKDETTTEALR
jgi:hypothetical protein